MDAIKLIIVVGVLVLATAGFELAHPAIDDAYIALRYARNLGEGLGLVFNPGAAPVEGYSCLSWVLLLSAVGWLGGDLELSASLLGILFAVATAVRLARAPHEELSTTARALGLAALVANPYFAFWSGKGLETALYAWLLTMGALALAPRWTRGEPDARWAVWFGLLAITRPEGIVYGGLSLLFFAAGLWRAGALSMRPLATATGLWLAPPLAQLVFRLAYYGDPLPNTYYAKVGAGGAVLQRGLAYLLDGAVENPAIPLSLLAALLLARARAPMVYLAALLLTGLAVIVGVGGDHFFGQRFFVPLLPLSVRLLQHGADALLERPTLAGGQKPLLVGAVAVTMGLAGVRTLSHTPTRDFVVLSSADMAARRVMGEWLREHTAPGEWIATPAAGMVPYVAERPTIDCLGLTDRTIGHREVEPGTYLPGHEKGDGAYVLARAPRFIVPMWAMPGPLEREDLLRMAFDRTTAELARMPAFHVRYRFRREAYRGGYVHVFERAP